MRRLPAIILSLATLLPALAGAESAAQQRRGGRQRGGQQQQPAGQPAAGEPAEPQRGGASSGETLIRNATILTASHGTLTNSDILIRGGKIAQVGQNLRAGSNARVIDATGKYVTPGIIDAHSHAASDAINEGTLSVTSMVRIEDVMNPTDINVYRALAGGVTVLNILHGSANTIGGQNAVVKTKYGRPIRQWFFGAPPGIKFALGENVTRKTPFALPGQPLPPQRYPRTRMGQEEVLRDAFTRARSYKRGWDDFNARRANQPPRRDLQLEPLVEVLDGRRLVHAHGYRADELLMLLNLADEFGFKVKTLQHVLEGYKIAPEIARHGAGGSLFADNWAYKIEAYDSIPYAAAIMTRAGVNTSINSDSSERVRRLNIDAAKMMKYGGLSEQEALRLITLNPAWQLGIDQRTGSIDVGKDADIAIWNGHPFSVYSRAEMTFIDGEVFFDRERDLAMRQERQRERAELERAEPNQAPGPAGQQGPGQQQRRRPPGDDGDDQKDNDDHDHPHGHSDDKGGRRQ
ncbi:MAG TPA: amidohydrolase [Pyrinomonadaceae bacterium]|nr:amidohydrolase [Pyrinomonadaceae bacterium]